jgi:hypothetical protein
MQKINHSTSFEDAKEGIDFFDKTLKTPNLVSVNLVISVITKKEAKGEGQGERQSARVDWVTE